MVSIEEVQTKNANREYNLPDAGGHFGQFGGKYAPEVLMPALDELEQAYAQYKSDPDFLEELHSLQADYVGRATPLYFAEGLTREMGGASIYLKREDLAHTGAHKINNALGQGLLARRMGKRRIIAETGAGQQALPQRIIDLVRAGVGQVFTLEVDARATALLAEPAGEGDRSRAPRIGAMQVIELGQERRITRGLEIGLLELARRGHQRLGQVFAAVAAKAAG